MVSRSAFDWFGRVVVAGVLVAASCGGGGANDRTGGSVDDPPKATGDEEGRSTVELTLTAPPDPNDELSFESVEGEALSAKRRARLAEQLPSVADSEAEATGSNAEESAAGEPPRDLSVVAFPSDEPSSADGEEWREKEGDPEFRVVRRSPKGETGAAPRLEVTFSRPVVEWDDEPDYRRVRPPVLLRPKVDGRWHWIGQRTVVFEPTAGRFPMATEYRAKIPSDVESIGGRALGEAVSWRFATAAPEVVEAVPAGEGHSRQPLVFLAFNQRVDPERVAESLRLWGGRARYDVHVASQPRIDGAEEMARRVRRAPDGQAVVAAPTSPLKAGTRYRWGLPRGIPSAEGSKVGKRAEYWSFRTREPLTVEEVGCGMERCRPDEPVEVRFSHRLAEEAEGPGELATTPELEKRRIEIRGRRLLLEGRWLGATAYRLEIPATVRDVHGRTLGRTVERSVEIGAPKPTVDGDGAFVTLRESDDPAYAVRSVGFETLEVRAWDVDPGDWPQFVRARDGGSEMPGRQRIDREIEVEGDALVRGRTSIPLDGMIEDGHGHAVVRIEGGEPAEEVVDASRGETTVQTWVQATDLAVDAHVDERKMIAQTTSLSSGKPRSDVRLELAGAEAAARTNEAGVAELPLPERPAEPWASVGGELRATRGGTTTILPERRFGRALESSWRRVGASSSARWMIFPDRRRYRPGEEVRVAGWLRFPDSDGEPFPDAGGEVAYALVGMNGTVHARGETEIGEAGAFDVRVSIPEDLRARSMHLGFRYGQEGDRRTAIHELRVVPPADDGDLDCRLDVPEPPHVAGEPIDANLRVRQPSGAPVDGGDVFWSVEAHSVQPNVGDWSGFVFGSVAGRSDRATLRREREGTTDVRGYDRTAIEVGREASGPRRVDIRAEVDGPGRRSCSAARTVEVHPTLQYVGIRPTRRFIDRGDPAKLELIAVGPEGKSVSGADIRVRARRVGGASGGGAPSVAETCDVASEPRAVECLFESLAPGRWELSAQVEGDGGRTHRSKVRLRVLEEPPASARRLLSDELRVMAANRRVSPGEHADLLVVGPKSAASGLATVEWRGRRILERRPIDLVDGVGRFSVSVDRRYAPEVDVRTRVVRGTGGPEDGELQAPRSRPLAFENASSLRVEVDDERRLQVEVEAVDPPLEPGGTGTIEVSVRDPEGSPVEEAQVVAVVLEGATDSSRSPREGRASLARYPGDSDLVRRRSRFLRTTVAGTGDSNSRGSSGSNVGRSEKGAGTAGASDGTSDAGGRSGVVRQLAFFPTLETDDEGEVRANIELPAQPGAFRVEAAAVHGRSGVGAGETTIRSREAVDVRVSLPDVLRVGDRTRAAIRMHNRSDERRQVAFVARGGGLTIDGESGVAATVEPGRRAEYGFTVRAQATGRATLDVAYAVDGGSAAVASDSVRVGTGSGRRTVEYDVADGAGAARRIARPGKSSGEGASLRLTTSPTPFLQLSDALAHTMRRRPAGPLERASRLSTAYMAADLEGELVRIDGMGGPDAEALVDNILSRYARERRAGRILGAKEGRDEFDLFEQLRTAAVILSATDDMRDRWSRLRKRARGMLENVRDRIPESWGPKLRGAVLAYAQRGLARSGSPRPGEVADIVEGRELSTLSTEAIAWLLEASAVGASETQLEDRLSSALIDRIDERDETARVDCDYGGVGHRVRYIPERAMAVALAALTAIESEERLAAKLAEALLRARPDGRWGSAQANTFAAEALIAHWRGDDRESSPNAVDVWLDDSYLGRHSYGTGETSGGRMVVDADLSVSSGERPTLGLAPTGSNPSGRIHYRLALADSAAPGREPEERGLTVERRYRAAGSGGSVRRRRGGIRVVPGSRVRGVVRIAVRARRRDVVIREPIPGGAELVEWGEAGADGSRGTESRWYDRRTTGNGEIAVVAKELPPGVYAFSYVLRAGVPGRYDVPPPVAEEADRPERFGRGESVGWSVGGSRDR